MMPTRILIIEDHVLVREAMALTLAQVGEGVFCQQASSAAEAIALLEEDPDCDLLVVDLMLPEMNGFSLLGVIAKRFPDVPALVVSALDDRESVHRAMKAGASGFVSKASPSNTLIEAVRTVLDGGVFTPEATSGSDGSGRTRRASQAFAERFQLTAAQGRVLELVAQGKSNRDIADLLGLSEGTVKVHVSAILRSLGVTSRAQALLLMTRAGLRV
ncbi:MAG TPA: response regulator transcription factor [Zoogloea sp.]|uniref:response regulator transcription factor n=2 Tax=Zoogloea sp. TaxID=49181 RepID=UPI002B6E6D43|nr:response regulator transcription factor [Zoogloea sp.]HMV17925.1 response regulator transcription factor [Rhodocyclaceae bacterium]HMV63237.1 response regulator transcription factor [Rhodocyclaceae bacterium]HMW52910.1 response regulator transcription factor [Rhodocyclaceae bacterium]HMY49737.1 response regulator transcription factor [Rhodocyclaceae bacterium]HMZ76674.1 response regulator transcription factor [Rhodocyclaceae bacterium]